MIIGVIKPVGPTSFDVVARVRKISGIKKVGHAGTLDPLASGVLVVAIGRASTKQIPELMQGEKEYVAEITLGMMSTTDDMEGEKTVLEVTTPPSIERVRAVLESFVGEIEQTPPAYSAIKVAGRRAYALARSGETVILTPRLVTILSINLIDYSWPVLKIAVRCGKGVYIRSLARDIGKALETGAFMSGLDRTRVGNFDYHNSIAFDELADRLPRMINKIEGI